MSSLVGYIEVYTTISNELHEPIASTPEKPVLNVLDGVMTDVKDYKITGTINIYAPFSVKSSVDINNAVMIGRKLMEANQQTPQALFRKFIQRFVLRSK